MNESTTDYWLLTPGFFVFYRLPFTLVFPWFLLNNNLINHLLRVEKESQEKKAYNGQKSEHHCPVFGQDPEKPATDDCDYTENDSHSDFSPQVHLITPPFGFSPI